MSFQTCKTHPHLRNTNEDPLYDIWDISVPPPTMFHWHNYHFDASKSSYWDRKTNPYELSSLVKNVLKWLDRFIWRTLSFHSHENSSTRTSVVVNRIWSMFTWHARTKSFSSYTGCLSFSKRFELLFMFPDQYENKILNSSGSSYKAVESLQIQIPMD